MYFLQVLSHWGYKNLLTTASPSHHEYLLSIGATQCFDYRDANVSSQIMESVPNQSPQIPFVIDCIGSKSGSLAQITKIAQRGSIVAVLLPVIVQDATEKDPPEYSMEVETSVQWAEGVETRGVRTHFYKDVSYMT